MDRKLQILLLLFCVVQISSCQTLSKNSNGRRAKKGDPSPPPGGTQMFARLEEYKDDGGPEDEYDDASYPEKVTPSASGESTPFNDAAEFYKRQQAMALAGSVGNPVSQVPQVVVQEPVTNAPQVAPQEDAPKRPRKNKNNKQAGNRKRKRPQLIRGGNNPLSPPLKFAVAQMKRPAGSAGRRRKQGAGQNNNNDQGMQVSGNSSMTSSNSSDLVQLKVSIKRKKVRKNGKQKNKKMNQKQKNRRKKKGQKKNRNGKNGTASNQFDYNRPPHMKTKYPINTSEKPPFILGPGMGSGFGPGMGPGMGSPGMGPGMGQGSGPGTGSNQGGGDDEYYYEYYDDPAPSGQGNGNSGGQQQPGMNNNGFPGGSQNMGGNSGNGPSMGSMGPGGPGGGRPPMQGRRPNNGGLGNREGEGEMPNPAGEMGNQGGGMFNQGGGMSHQGGGMDNQGGGMSHQGGGMGNQGGSMSNQNGGGGFTMLLPQATQAPDPQTFCQSQNFNDATYCCSLPVVNFFDPDDMDECLEDMESDEEPSSIEEYTLNRGLVGKGEVDFNVPGMKNLSDTICLTHCTLLSLQFLKVSEKSLDFDNMNTYIKLKLAASKATDWADNYNSWAYSCQAALGKMSNVVEQIDNPESTCYTKPYLYIQCIKNSFLMNCPKPSDRASSDFCKDSMKNMVQCNPFD